MSKHHCNASSLLDPAYGKPAVKEETEVLNQPTDVINLDTENRRYKTSPALNYLTVSNPNSSNIFQAGQ